MLNNAVASLVRRLTKGWVLLAVSRFSRGDWTSGLRCIEGLLMVDENEEQGFLQKIAEKITKCDITVYLNFHVIRRIVRPPRKNRHLSFIPLNCQLRFTFSDG